MIFTNNLNHKVAKIPHPIEKNIMLYPYPRIKLKEECEPIHKFQSKSKLEKMKSIMTLKTLIIKLHNNMVLIITFWICMVVIIVVELHRKPKVTFQQIIRKCNRSQSMPQISKKVKKLKFLRLNKSFKCKSNRCNNKWHSCNTSQ